MLISLADNEVVWEFTQLLSLTPANHVRINLLVRQHSHQLRLHYHVSLLQVSDDVKLRHSDVLFAVSNNSQGRRANVCNPGGSKTTIQIAAVEISYC